MSKEELFKKYQEIVLKTNGGADDYVVALCQISNLIKDYAEEKDQQIADLQNQLAITEKALELACKEITGSCAYCSYKTRIECPVEADCLNENINYFKTKAKERLENE